MRGEDSSHAFSASESPGSPPHARGRRTLSIPSPRRPGITPACAGKTAVQTGSKSRSKDHPRMRGEDDEMLSTQKIKLGSPPHARGRRPGFERKALMQGITPACAGKTAVQTGSKSRSKDHPRMRGEDVRDPHKLGECEGSPPHARGRPMLDVHNEVNWWITPACAGKTSCMNARRTESPDHPRMRGEDRKSPGFSGSGSGSPPHARGRRTRSSPTCRPARITPACAGKTVSTASASLASWDHPRMRGEDSVCRQ